MKTNARQYKILEKSEIVNHLSFECKICGQRKRSPTNMKYHLSTCHNVVQSFSQLIRKCKIWDFRHSKYIVVAKHMKTVHESEEMYLWCNMCSYKTAIHSRLKMHMSRVHLKIRIKRHESSFTGHYNNDVNNHKLRAHEGLRYKCEYCNFISVSKVGLKKHNINYHR